MDIKNKTVLVLGAWGLVGNAVTRKIVTKEPKRIIVTSLFEKEARAHVENLSKEFSHLPKDYFIPWWGNIFVRNEFKDENRFDILNASDTRETLMKDTMEDLTADVLQASSIYQLVSTHKPDIIIDCINSATGIAYQDVYSTYRTIRNVIKKDEPKEKIIEETEKLLCTLYIPQLIRHIQILYNSMNKVGTKIYIKIGTSGTGGMGLNIPYTHSEEKPSRVLLSKSSVAGAHTLLLFLMGRTPQGAITKEIKPTAAIAWKKIAYGEIQKGGRPIEIVDMKPENAIQLEDKLAIDDTGVIQKLGANLKSVFIDTGENGTFSRGEFEAITSQGQMEYVTPEEIADNVIYEILGGNTGHDIINALDNATMEPSYRAGFLQHSAVDALEEMEKLQETDSVAFELLGPPRLSKLLFEIYLLKKSFKSMPNIVSEDPIKLSEALTNEIKSNQKIRSEILSIGIPILLPDGKSILRGEKMKIPPYRGESELEISDEMINLWSNAGWVDLRISNMKFWQKRINALMDEAESIPLSDTSSMHVRTKKYWSDFEKIDIGKVVGWIFIQEEQGKRMKS